jgi:hypothetical protein
MTEHASSVDIIFLQIALLHRTKISNNQYEGFRIFKMLNIKQLKDNYLMLNFLSDGEIIQLMEHVRRASLRINMSIEEILQLIDEEIQREMPHV